jgi:hypothetical protein
MHLGIGCLKRRSRAIGLRNYSKHMNVTININFGEQFIQREKLGFNIHLDEIG